MVLAKVRRNGAVVWATFLGGGNDEEAYRVKTTPSGGVIISGATESSDFPTHSAFDNSYGGNVDGFVSHFDKDGMLITSSYVGGTGSDYVFSADINSAGKLAVIGSTDSPGWLASPTLAAGNAKDYFLVCATEHTIDFTSYLGGSSDEDEEYRPDVVIDDEGRTFAVGTTSSSDFPTTAAYQASYGGQTDGFVVGFTPDGSLNWSTYLGANQKESLTSIAIHGDLLLLGGNTNDASLPLISANAYQTSLAGQQDGLIALMRKHGSLSHASYLGGSKNDEILMLAHTETHFSWVGNSDAWGSLTYNAQSSTPEGGDDGHIGAMSIAEIDGSVDAYSDASSCDSGDGEVTLKLDTSMLGLEPYDLSLDGGATWPDSLSNLSPNASNELVYGNLQWGTYKVHIRDALGTISSPSTLNITGCVVEICTANSTATLEFAAVAGANNYAWTTSIGTISTGQGTEAIEINTDGLVGGASGTVCVQPEGDGCYAPEVCIDVLIICPEICSDSIDNDGDGEVDCSDVDCPSLNPVVRVSRGS